ncbi:hypothetical protein E2C01_093113 [Portunus trituberculatus]|uniref:Uncharacterized protein n=1 Tax=Portunus trituberculatus TaxID=210409 RepID=A0A5B7JI72_PORTR|nr:hypothetical protein [Portunus trituberculatus]
MRPSFLLTAQRHSPGHTPGVTTLAPSRPHRSGHLISPSPLHYMLPIPPSPLPSLHRPRHAPPLALPPPPPPSVLGSVDTRLPWQRPCSRCSLFSVAFGQTEKNSLLLHSVKAL